jgi:acyl-CoA thioesterase
MSSVLDNLKNQAEHEHISTSLEVEQLEINLFRSKSLGVPLLARGVFGGFVVRHPPQYFCGLH